MSPRRRILAVRISDDARDAIQAHCVKHGITITAWIEALGIRVNDLSEKQAADVSLQQVSDETVRLAREIDADRRTRS